MRFISWTTDSLCKSALPSSVSEHLFLISAFGIGLPRIISENIALMVATSASEKITVDLSVGVMMLTDECPS